MKYNLIINTHWDREYRWSFPETQLRLVEAVDDLVRIMQNDGKFKYFHTDSQVSMLDDYLEAKPEMEEAVRKLVSEGRILTGPWYTLPAEFLVNGEALVRNIMMGHKYAGKLGKVMKAGYNIFSWGQVSQLPQIYHQFGMDTIIFYRGIDQSRLDRLEFRWRGADDTEVLGITFGPFHRLNFWHFVYLPYILGKSGEPVGRDSLGEAFLTHLCEDNMMDIDHWIHNQQPARDLEAAKAGLQELIETVIHKSSTDEILFLQGFDQENPDPIVTELVDLLNQGLEDGGIRVASLEDYVRNVQMKVVPELREKLAVRSGEMLAVERQGDAYGPLYNGVFSARMPVKLANAEAEYLLINSAEPIAAWLSMEGNEYPAVQMEQAWKELLKNQQHDGIGGCHVDCVSDAMMSRYRFVKETAHAVIKSSLRRLGAEIDSSFIGEREIGLILFNPAFLKKEEIVVCNIDVPSGWGLRNGREMSVRIEDAEGRPVESQMLSQEDNTLYTYLKYGNVFRFPATRCRVAVHAADLPENGYMSLKAIPCVNGTRYIHKLSMCDNEMENEFLKVNILWNGTFTVLDKKTGREFRNLHYFEDCGDKGGPLVFDPPFERMQSSTLSCPAAVSLIYNGPLMATYCIVHEWKVPAAIEAELKIHVPHGSEWIEQGRPVRSRREESVEIKTYVTLKKGARGLEFKTVVDNHARDHRLRVIFPTDLEETEYCRTDAPFDIVRRRIAVPDSTGWYEAAARTWPSHSFVALSGKEVTAAVFHKGIAEYEVTDNCRRAIAMTLLRCFSNAGNPTEFHEYQELAECQGEHTFEYVFSILDGDVTDGELARQALRKNIPVYALQATGHQGNRPWRRSFLEVDSEEFVVTACYCEESALIIRGYHTGEASRISVKLGAKAAEAWKVNLEGIEKCALHVEGEVIEGIPVKPREIVSIKVKLEERP